MKKNKLQKHFEEALRYAKNEIDDYRIEYVIREMDRCRCPATLVNGTIDEAIEKMNEYAIDNELEENFWSEEYDDDEIAFRLYDLIEDNCNDC